MFCARVRNIRKTVGSVAGMMLRGVLLGKIILLERERALSVDNDMSHELNAFSLSLSLNLQLAPTICKGHDGKCEGRCVGF
jgi:hypothetical protein